MFIVGDLQEVDLCQKRDVKYVSEHRSSDVTTRDLTFEVEVG